MNGHLWSSKISKGPQAVKNVIGFFAQLHMKSKSLSKRELSNDPLTQAFCKTLQLLLLQIVPPQTDLGNIAPI